MERMIINLIILVICVNNIIQFGQGADDCKPMSFAKLCMKDQNSTVVLENEKLSLTINKAKADIISLHYNSHKEPAKRSVNLLQGGSGYYLANIAIHGKGSAVGPHNSHMKITQNTESRIDLAFIEKDPKVWPIEFELHLVLEKGSSMFYYYSIHRYTHDMPDGYAAGQLRWALRTNEAVFKHYNVDGKRAGLFPNAKSLDGAKELQDWTYRLKDGSVYSKYQHISSDEDVSSVFGVFDDHLGLSLIQPNKEWSNGGPFKQDLTTHPGGVPPSAGGAMILFHEHSGHYGTPELAPSKGWNKVYGPISFYVNEGDSPDTMYKDAVHKLKEEESKWPYKWVTAEEYNINSRGTVSGTIKVSDGTKPEWAFVILTDPHVEDPQLESATYMYRAKAGADGKFSIPGVRSGTYKMQIIAKGVVGKYVQNGIKVQANHNTNLETVNWQPESHGQLLWQIGIPDRKAAEFHSPAGSPSPVPNLEEYRKFGTWLSYNKEFPNDIDFTVGRSDPSKHWCYFMPQIKTPGFLAQLTEVGIKQIISPTNWKVRFEYKGTGHGQATLTLGLAASVRGGVRALINGHQILKLDSFEGPKGDSSLFRQAAHGIYRQYSATFNTSLLKQDQNLMEFTPPGPVSANHFDQIVMWDFLRLEIKE